MGGCLALIWRAAEAGLKVSLQEDMVAEHTVGKPVESVDAALVPAGVYVSKLGGRGGK